MLNLAYSLYLPFESLIKVVSFAIPLVPPHSQQRQVNSTVSAMVLKVNNPTRATDLRPSACCNTIYKCITKLICERLKLVLNHLVDKSQGASVEGRSILYNILNCVNLVKMYNRKGISPTCMIKVDLKKAYDPVRWEFAHKLLICSGSPMKFVKRVMTCISIASFFINLNGELYGYFHSTRELRQGDPMSPLIFVLVVEYLT